MTPVGPAIVSWSAGRVSAPAGIGGGSCFSRRTGRGLGDADARRPISSMDADPVAQHRPGRRRIGDRLAVLALQEQVLVREVGRVGVRLRRFGEGRHQVGAGQIGAGPSSPSLRPPNRVIAGHDRLEAPLGSIRRSILNAAASIGGAAPAIDQPLDHGAGSQSQPHPERTAWRDSTPGTRDRLLQAGGGRRQRRRRARRVGEHDDWAGPGPPARRPRARRSGRSGSPCRAAAAGWPGWAA